MTTTEPATATTLHRVTSSRVKRTLRRRAVIAMLAVPVLAAFAVTLMVGETFYPAGDVWRVILGETVPGASFTVGELRLPRAVLAVFAGFCFGIGGVTFQTMLRNPLASPDIIGITSGAGAAASFAIVVLGLKETGVSVFAIAAGLAVAIVVYTLSFKDGVAGTRLILIGIGMAAMLDSATAYVLSKAAQWDLQQAQRWLTGSLNGSTWDEVLPVALALLVLGPVLLSQARNLGMLRLGDDAAAALGVRLERTRILVIVAAVGLIAFATAATGPIAFVAFLSGPIAARIIGPAGSLLLPSGLVGALLVLTADFVGQFAFRRPLSGGRGDRRARRPLPRLPAHPNEPRGRHTMTVTHSLEIEKLSLGYGDRVVIDELDLVLPPGKITAIVGANACGKSTLLRSLSRLLAPRTGHVLLDGREVHRMPAKELARTLGLLPAVAGGTGGHHGGGPGRTGAASASAGAVALEQAGRRCRGRGAGRHAHR